MTPDIRDLGFLGIDPGLSGAFGFVVGGKAFAWDVPTYKVKVAKGLRTRLDEDALQRLVYRIARMSPERALLELVGGMRDDDGSRHMAFTFGFSAGQIRQAIVAAGIPRDGVQASVWKLRMGLRGQTKDASRALASQLFPSSAHLFARKKDDGRAEAVLLAEYARRTYLGGLLNASTD